mgnify:CR=1 FL=1
MLRFIPACAGNSRKRLPITNRLPVHPRLRGELISENCNRICQRGSSPLARGTQKSWHYYFLLRRFIPACAGNSRNPFFSASSVVGSSPLARGTHSWHNHGRAPKRFIPACAGNSTTVKTDFVIFTVHPRLRGELLAAITGVSAAIGSSPLARGTHLKWLQHYTNRLTAKLLKNISKQE